MVLATCLDFCEPRDLQRASFLPLNVGAGNTFPAGLLHIDAFLAARMLVVAGKESGGAVQQATCAVHNRAARCVAVEGVIF